MVVFNTSYTNTMDMEYFRPQDEPGDDIEKPIRPVIPVSEIGKSVTEGRSGGGTFRETLKAAIFEGASKVELSTQMEGGEPFVGAEAYGKEARQDLREMAKVNQVKIVSVHAPAQIGNVSGYQGPERGFDDGVRKTELEEIKKAIEFAADVKSNAIVFHTGEFNRPITDQTWAVDEKGKQVFTGYEEESERAIIPLVDKRTGHVIHQVRKNQLVARARWNKYEEDNKDVWDEHGGKSFVDANGRTVKPGDYVDYWGNKIEERKNRVPMYDKENNTFIIQTQDWNVFKKEAEEINEEKRRKAKMEGRELKPDEIITPEEAFLYATTETNEKIARGWALNYSERLKYEFEIHKKLKKAREFYKRMEDSVPEEEQWKILRQDDILQRMAGKAGFAISPEYKKPVDLIDAELKDIERSIESQREMVTGQLQSAEEAKIMRDSVTSVEKYALEKSLKSMAELGIHAMKQSTEKGANVFIAPENIFPEMGYGSHPQELIKLVQSAREKMAGELVEHYKMAPEKARKEAEDHIKATLDTQHLGMWWKHFIPKPNETEEETRKRFNGWYMKQIEDMDKAKIIGHIHIVDGFGRGHTHLPASQGMVPVVSAVEYLKKKGYKGSMISEAYGEQGRQLTRTWAAFGSPIYNLALGPMGTGSTTRWGDVWQSYFGKDRTPYYVVGNYSPSNEWTFWSQVPIE